MTNHPDERDARAIIEANEYLTLATADASGRPWASPVWFAHRAYRDLLWVSRPGARHSRNIAVRPEIGAVIFDSTVPVGEGRGVYLAASAAVVDESVEEAIAAYADRTEERIGTRWDASRVTGAAPFGLYRARITEAFVLDDHDQRVPVELG